MTQSSNMFNSDSVKDKLHRYARMIFEENSKYNLTGFKTIDEIQENLILKSSNPVQNLSVPRGTRFVDIGTGSGIPGIVLSLCFPEAQGLLVDSNGKKTGFIQSVIEEIELQNVQVVNARIEILGHLSEYRGMFDWCFSRAFGPLYSSVELGLPLLKKGGFLYVYSNKKAEELPNVIIDHIADLGGTALESNAMCEYGLKNEGILVVKQSSSPKKYPRKFPVIKREAAKIDELLNNVRDH